MTNYTPKAGEFCWNELMTGNPTKAKAFYSALLGWDTHDVDMGEMTYTLFKSGEKEICGMMEIPKDQPSIPPHWMSYIMVDDLDKSVEKAQSLGASINVPPQEIPNIGRFAVLADPTGANIALWQSTKAE